MISKVSRPSQRYLRSVFINCPYDVEFEELFLAYVVGVCSFGFIPRTTLEIEGGEQRLRRIAELIRGCYRSFHDMSRVELDKAEPKTPRFNMSFETGLAVMHSLTIEEPPGHKYFLFESNAKRLRKSLSDLDGSDVYVHGSTVEGVLSRIGDALLNAKRRPSLAQMLTTLHTVKRAMPHLLVAAGAHSLFLPRPYRDLVGLATDLVHR